MKPKPKKPHANRGNKNAQRGPARRVPVFVRLPPATLATLKVQAAALGLSQSDTVIASLNVLESLSMKSIHITDAQAEILDSGDQTKSDSIARQLRTKCQAQANATGKTCEIYHPEGYVWDAREPN
jgi:hypothetical protein